MTEFKRTQIIETRLKEDLTPDNQYWKRLDFPTTTKHYGFINGLEFSPIEPYHFAVSYSTKVDVYDPNVNKPVSSFTRFKKAAYGGSFRHDGKLFVVGGEDGRVKLFSVDSKLMLRLFKGHEASVHYARFIKNSRSVCGFSDDKTVRTWDLSTEQELQCLRGHTDYIRCGAVSNRTPDMIVSGSYDHTVKLWDLRQTPSLASDSIQGSSSSSQHACLTLDHGCPVEAVLMFPNDSLVVSAGGTSIKLWDIASGGKQLLQLTNHRKTISSLCFASDYSRLLSGSLDRHIKIYDLATYQVVHTLDFPAPVVKIGISKDDNVLAVAMTDCLVSIQHRLPEKSSLKKPKTSRLMSRRFLIGAGSYCEQPDVVVREESNSRLSTYDQYLRTFQHKKALDSLLKNHYFYFRHPEVVLSLLKELIRRRALEKALSDREEETLIPVVKFVSKHIGKAPFTSVMIDTANVLFDLYGKKLQEFQTTTIDAFRRLQTVVDQQLYQMQSMARLMGLLEMTMVDGNAIGVVSSQTSIVDTQNRDEACKTLFRLLDGETENEKPESETKKFSQDEQQLLKNVLEILALSGQRNLIERCHKQKNESNLKQITTNSSNINNNINSDKGCYEDLMDMDFENETPESSVCTKNSKQKSTLCNGYSKENSKSPSTPITKSRSRRAFK